MSPLKRAETPFNNAQALIGTGGIFGGQPVIIGLNHPLAVGPSGLLNRGSVNANLPIVGDGQIPLGAGGSE